MTPEKTYLIMNIDVKRIKGIIFDYGGTLDTGGDHWSEVIWDAWQKAGVAADKAMPHIKNRSSFTWEIASDILPYSIFQNI